MTLQPPREETNGLHGWKGSWLVSGLHQVGGPTGVGSVGTSGTSSSLNI